MRVFIYFSPNEQCGGVGGGYAARRFLLLFFPCSADHERDWPPCKVVFFGLATNTLNVRNNNNNNIKDRLAIAIRSLKDRYVTIVSLTQVLV